MNTEVKSFPWRTFTKQAGLAVALALVLVTSASGESVPVRVSFKFILNSAGHRPATGDIHTDAEVNSRVADANAMFARVISELRVENLGIEDVSGISSYYTAEPTAANRDSLRAAAIADPTTYHWRNDAVNVYVNAAQGTSASAIADFPPNNNIILVSANVWDNVVAHEVGHILNLYHTHQPGGDSCADTLMDSVSWTTEDMIAAGNFGVPYASLNASQQYQVDQVFWNVMSYHNADDGDQAFRLTPDQMDRQSTEAYTDRNRLLASVPVYVDGSYGGSPNGSFTLPYRSVQQAINSGVLQGKVIVLQQGAYARPAGAMNAPMTVCTRSGASSLQCLPVPYSLPTVLEASTNQAVRAAVVRAQQSDRLHDLAAVVKNLKEAEKSASGGEKTALQLELAHRYRDSQQYDEAANWFNKAAAETDQQELRKRALKKSIAMKNLGELHRQVKVDTK